MGRRGNRHGVNVAAGDQIAEIGVHCAAVVAVVFVDSRLGVSRELRLNVAHRHGLAGRVLQEVEHQRAKRPRRPFQPTPMNPTATRLLGAVRPAPGAAGATT